MSKPLLAIRFVYLFASYRNALNKGEKSQITCTFMVVITLFTVNRISNTAPKEPIPVVTIVPGQPVINCQS